MIDLTFFFFLFLCPSDSFICPVLYCFAVFLNDFCFNICSGIAYLITLSNLFFNVMLPYMFLSCLSPMCVFLCLLSQSSRDRHRLGSALPRFTPLEIP